LQFIGIFEFLFILLSLNKKSFGFILDVKKLLFITPFLCIFFAVFSNQYIAREKIAV